MSAPISIGSRQIGGGAPVFLIAEIGSNHNGDLSLAKRHIDEAAAAGADAVKFQIFKAEELYPPTLPKLPSWGNEPDFDLIEAFRKAEVGYDWIPQLKEYADSRGVTFLAAPFDVQAVDALEAAGVEAYKIGSPELNHIPLLKKVAKTGKSVIFSEGLGTLADMDLAVNTLLGEGNSQLVMLHCVSCYPAPPEQYSLNVLKTIRRVFGVQAGVSDHTTEPTLIPRIATALGAAVIEKHFTVDKKLPGPDHFFAMEPQEFRAIVQAVRETEGMSEKEKASLLSQHPDILGGYEKRIAPCELEQKLYPGDKRWLFTAQPIAKGEKFTRGNLRVLRGERFLKEPGLHPQYFELLLGKTCKQDVDEWQPVYWHHVLD